MFGDKRLVLSVLTRLIISGRVVGSFRPRHLYMGVDLLHQLPRLFVSSSSMGPVGFCVVGRGSGKGIWLGSLKWESLGTPEVCKAANQPS